MRVRQASLQFLLSFLSSLHPRSVLSARKRSNYFILHAESVAFWFPLANLLVPWYTSVVTSAKFQGLEGFYVLVQPLFWHIYLLMVTSPSTMRAFVWFVEVLADGDVSQY